MRARASGESKLQRRKGIKVVLTIAGTPLRLSAGPQWRSWARELICLAALPFHVLRLLALARLWRKLEYELLRARVVPGHGNVVT